jgi:ABC-type multidrug transport system fused ATPase/permease subunit
MYWRLNYDGVWIDRALIWSTFVFYLGCLYLIMHMDEFELRWMLDGQSSSADSNDSPVMYGEEAVFVAALPTTSLRLSQSSSNCGSDVSIGHPMLPLNTARNNNRQCRNLSSSTSAIESFLTIAWIAIFKLMALAICLWWGAWFCWTILGTITCWNTSGEGTDDLECRFMFAGKFMTVAVFQCLFVWAGVMAALIRFPYLFLLWRWPSSS